VIDTPDLDRGPRRIAIIGSTGSGKTTLARRLSEGLGIPHVELDSLNWGPGWEAAPTDVLRARVGEALAGGAWVTDGNYGQARDIVWGRADTLVWLEMPLPLALWRVVSRTLRRIVTREELWNGNRETVGNALLSRDGLVVYLFTSRKSHRQRYPALLAKPEYAHLRIAHLRTPREVRRWLESVVPRQGSTPAAGGTSSGRGR
jgi:adenylate kinase family enzyme